MFKKFKTEQLAAWHVVKTLQDCGHVAYFAGGCVRDTLLGNEPKDFDVATDATPDRVQEIFPKTKAVGAAFGVVLASIKADARRNWEIEVATFRSDGEYSDGRRPDSVVFCSAEEDAERRDFTINGLFMDPEDNNKIIDFVGGQEDLERKVIRAIGDPAQRFKEDYLRMLRAVRFASRLGFDIEADTTQAIIDNAKKLSDISRERIGIEVIKMLQNKSGAVAIQLMQKHKLDGPVLGEDPFDHDPRISLALSNRADEATRLAAWMADRYNIHEGRKFAIDCWKDAMCLSNDICKRIKSRLNIIEEVVKWRHLDVVQKKRLVARMDVDQDLIFFDAMGGSGSMKIIEDIDDLMLDGIGIEPEPLINGDVLKDHGIKPGPKYKQIIDEAYDKQLAGDISDEAEAVEWVKSIA